MARPSARCLFLLLVSFITSFSKMTANYPPVSITIYPDHLLYGLILPVVGARLLFYGIPIALQSEENVAQGLITELEEKIEKRRNENDDDLDILRQQLNGLKARSGNNETPQIISLQKKLEKLEEKAQLISLDYQAEYVQISPRARSEKEQAASRVIKGAFCLFTSLCCFSAKR